MAKKTDKLTELPKLDEWKAPWEVDDSGKDIADDEQEIDPGRLKKYLYNLLGDKLKLQSQVDETTTRAEELEQKVANAADPAKLTELQQEVTKAREERDAATAKAEKDGQSSTQVLRLEVALEKGLTAVQAKRLLGSTKEELEQDAEELLASFGGTGLPAGGGDDDEAPVRRGPKKVFRNAGDPDAGADKGEKEEQDPDTWAASYAAKRGRGLR